MVPALSTGYGCTRAPSIIPGALDFYIRSGFAPFRRQIEVADDPRAIGLLPKDRGASRAVALSLARFGTPRRRAPRTPSPWKRTSAVALTTTGAYDVAIGRRRRPQ